MKEATKRMSELLKIDYYDELDFSNELNIETLIKAKEYFMRNMETYGYAFADAKKELELRHTYYKLKFAEAKDRWQGRKDEATGKYFTATRAEDKATMDVDYVRAKDAYAEAVGFETECRTSWELCRKRVDALSQHISGLKQEANFTQFVKENSNNNNDG